MEKKYSRLVVAVYSVSLLVLSDDARKRAAETNTTLLKARLDMAVARVALLMRRFSLPISFWFDDFHNCVHHLRYKY